MIPFDPSQLPDLPQSHLLARVVAELWQDPAVVCVWLTGSLARGEGDEYSDVDLGVALVPASFSPKQLPAAARLLQETTLVHTSVAMSDHATLHHLLLADGTLYDFMVQSTEHSMREQRRVVLACRDDALVTQLAAGGDPSIRVQPADPQVIRESLTTFWMAQLRHQKVLYRNLGLVAWTGEQLMRQELIRLWYVHATGNDCGPLRQMTIHTLSPVVQAVRVAQGDRALALIGQPLRTRREILAATGQLCDEVARLGQQLADQLGFIYPTEIETLVLRRWQQVPTLDDRDE